MLFYFRVTVKPEKDEFAESVAEFMQRNRMRINLPQITMATVKPSMSSMTPVTEFISKELRTPDNFVVDLNLGNLHNKDSSGTVTYTSQCFLHPRLKTGTRLHGRV